MRILVTGGTGFVGCNVVRYLAACGDQVVALDTAAPDATLGTFWESVSDRICFVRGDVMDVEGIRSLLREERIDTVVHAAAITTTSEEDPGSLIRLLQVNLQGSVSMLDAAVSEPSIKRFLFISSAAVYGPSTEGSPVSETASIDTTIAYGQAKYAIEAAVRYAHKEGEFETAALRLGWIYGPMERPTSARTRMSEIWQLCRAARQEGELRINDLTAARDWTYSEDVGQAVRSLLKVGGLPHRIYNLSGGEGFRTESVIRLLQKRFPDLPVTVVPEEKANVIVNTKNRRGYLDIQRLREDVGFHAAHDMAAGIDAYITWLQEMGEE